MEGPPCRWYDSVYTRMEVSANIRGCTCAPVYTRGYKACHVPAGVLPPGVRSSGPNQPASPNQLQRAAGPTTIEITLSRRAGSLLRDSRFSFSLKCHALEMGPFDCRPLDRFINFTWPQDNQRPADSMITLIAHNNDTFLFLRFLLFLLFFLWRIVRRAFGWLPMDPKVLERLE